MTFNSYIFILAFLPIMLLVYYILRFLKWHVVAKLSLILASVIFIGVYDARFWVFIGGTLVINIATGFILRALTRANKKIFSRIVLAVGILLNVLALGYFKYAEFIVEVFKIRVSTDFFAAKILVPLGISFVTFQQIAFLVDVFRKKITQINVIDYIFYITYFPKYIQGPITKYEVLIGDINSEENYRPNADNLAYGLWLFITGLGKKVLLADIFANAVTWGWANLEALTAVEALLITICFTLQIYFDFSGYSSMAIGVSKMLNIRLADNFDSPYQATSIIDFWKKWHISLTDFLREYVYFPLGGSKKGKIRTYLNIMIIFLLSGLWHGAAWTYILWGALHGAANCLNRIFKKQWDKLNAVLSWALTFGFVNAAWVFFRASTIQEAWKLLCKIARMQSTHISNELIECFRIPEITFFMNRFEGFAKFVTDHRGFELSVFLIVGFALVLSVKDKCVEKFKPTFMKCILSMTIFFWSIISLSSVVEFIYENF